ncbi:MAG TPA: NAD(P)-dependent oxidoreductase [Stellaceae bacterium]|nr:NAD(P)-dependent oxidoreductase [Stellaceae bacterium]
MASLGWIGMGRIGTQMAMLLLRAGHRLVIHDADPNRSAPALKEGARAAGSPAELAAETDAVFLSVTDADAVQAIVFGSRGLAEGIGASALVVDHTSIHPARTRELAARLRDRTQAAWVDAPVSGSPGSTLAVFLGGAAADIARVRPWIASYARTMTHVGPVGAGQIAKSCNQAIVCATLAAWAEVLAYAQQQGLDPATLMTAVEGGGAESSVRRYFLQDLLARRLPPETLRNLTKDLETMHDMALTASLPMPLNEAVSTQFRRVFAASIAADGQIAT